ncbi:hypothetical protein [Gorillibacterium sp. sgz5001074]|uniref:hypothetical protein n=1 Tax=Gorillibacterium sp. sgz5001074 TaxID=3446695 RepID=UPI003F668A51
MGFRNLWMKELRGVLPIYAVYAVAVVILNAIIFYKIDIMQDDTIFVLSLLLPFMLVSALTVGLAYYQLHIEWKTNTVYLLFSLPMRGWKILTAKLSALLLFLIAALLWTGVCFSPLLFKVDWVHIRFDEEFREMLPELLRVMLNCAWIFLLAVIFLLVLIQFTFLCGQLAAKLKWVFMLCAFFGMLWLVMRISPLLTGLLGWLPGIPMEGDEWNQVFLQSGAFLVMAFLCAGLTVLNGYLIEKEVEV